MFVVQGIGQDFMTRITPVHDVVFEADAGENLIDLVGSTRFIPSTLARQRLSIFRLALRKIVPKNLRKVVRKSASEYRSYSRCLARKPSRASSPCSS